MSWKLEFALLLIFTSTINYFGALKIDHASSEKARKLWMAFTVLMSLGLLIYFKYAGFFINGIAALSKTAGLQLINGSNIKILLPIGISFFSFQALSYTIDVYKRKMEAERNIIDFFLFVSFFPTLISGPISRAKDLIGQFRTEQHFSSDRLIEGLKLIIWGLFKKVVIADRLALYVDRVYSAPDIFGGSTLFLATLFFTFQIYCDFSGYSDIAIGSARILGFDLFQNFNLPYLASSIKDFWKRWHMSLTSWFRDYVFLPVSFALAGKIRGEKVLFMKKEMFIYIFASGITWMLTGLWHGASNTFIIWGLIQGFFLILYQWQVNPRKRLFKKIGITKKNTTLLLIESILTFGIVMISWVFFRANSVKESTYILCNMFTGWDRIPYLGPSAFENALNIALIILLFVVQILQYRGLASLNMSKSRMPRLLTWMAYATLLIMIAMLGISTDRFIYFQF